MLGQSLDKQWTNKQVVVFFAIAIPLVWLVSSVAFSASPTEMTRGQLRALWGLLAAALAFMIVRRRSGPTKDKIIYPLLAVFSSAFSILTVILTWWLLVKYPSKPGAEAVFIPDTKPSPSIKSPTPSDSLASNFRESVTGYLRRVPWTHALLGLIALILLANLFTPEDQKQRNWYWVNYELPDMLPHTETRNELWKYSCLLKDGKGKRAIFSIRGEAEVLTIFGKEIGGTKYIAWEDHLGKKTKGNELFDSYALNENCVFVSTSPTTAVSYPYGNSIPYPENVN